MQKVFKILFIPFLFTILLLAFFWVFKEQLISYGLSQEDTEVFHPEVKYKIPESVRIPILIYHHIREYENSDSEVSRTYIVSSDNFKQQMNYLKDSGYQTIGFNDLELIFQGKEKSLQIK